MYCKPCTWSGYLDDGRKVSYKATELKEIRFFEPGDKECPMANP